MKKAILVVTMVCVVFLSSCSSSSMTFTGKTNHWNIKMVVTSEHSNEDIKVTYKFKGTMEQLKKFKHIKLSFDGAGGAAGNKVLNSKNGLTEKQYEVNLGSSGGAKVTRDSKPKVTIVLGKGKSKHKEETNLELNQK